MARKDPIAHLGRHDLPPPRLVKEILGLGPPGLETLVAMASDRTRWEEEPVAVGNALFVLAQAPSRAGVEPALAALVDAPTGSRVFSGAFLALGQLLRPEDAPLLLDAELDDTRSAIATHILVQIGYREPPLWARIEAILERDPADGARLAREVGDAALVPAVQRAFERIVGQATTDHDELHVASLLLEALIVSGERDEVWIRRLQAAYARAHIELKEESHAMKLEIAALRSRRSRGG